jgi:hypothetical protein
MVLKKAVQGCLYWYDGLCSFLIVVPVLPFVIYCQCWFYMADQMQLIENDLGGLFGCVLFLFALPCVPWILLYGYVIIPNEPYVKFCKDGSKVGVTDRVRAVLSKETETWECPPKPGSTWVKQFPRAYSKGYEWQCNETYCTADELASPESCLSATVSLTVDGNYHGDFLRTCDNWSADNPGCCVNADYDRTYVECEYCIPDKEILWAISTFAGIATFIPFFCWSLTVWDGLSWERDSRLAIEEKAKKEAEEKAKKEAEEKAKKDAEAAEQGV